MPLTGPAQSGTTDHHHMHTLPHIYMNIKIDSHSGSSLEFAKKSYNSLLRPAIAAAASRAKASMLSTCAADGVDAMA
jgi:hypothetical protein